MHQDDREKTAFVTPFGLCNAPATFQNFMEEVLEPFRPFVAGLLNDVAVWGDSVEELDKQLNLIMTRLVKYGLILNARPKNKPIVLTSDSKKAWLLIKDAISSAPIMKRFNWKLPIVPETDASQKFLGAALLQPHTHYLSNKHRSIFHSIAYFSRKLNEIQQRYSAQERELLSILLSLQHWRHWVEGSDVTVITDHESPRSIKTKAEQPARILRFLESIEHYGVRIIYRKGNANVLADYLSRPPDLVFSIEEREMDINNQQQMDLYPEEDLEKIQNPEQLNRINLQCIFEFLTQNRALPSNLTENWVYKNFGVYNNKLHRIIPNKPINIGDLPVAQGAITYFEILEYEELIDVAKSVHENLGHASVGTTTREVSLRF